VAGIFQIKFGSMENIKILEEKKKKNAMRILSFPNFSKPHVFPEIEIRSTDSSLPFFSPCYSFMHLYVLKLLVNIFSIFFW
jgi:hypothetical protein